MKKSIEKLRNSLSISDSGKMKGGFASVKGGMILVVQDNSRDCSNTVICGSTNNGSCSNTGDCTQSTNIGSLGGKCSNSTFCAF